MDATPDRQRWAESFGTDPERYDRSRPTYPAELIERIAAAAPGPDAVDVGIGTGISARPLEAAGAHVLGVEADPRMAEVARHRGFTVEVARFEDWDPAGRTFDLVAAGQTWHWIDPAAGASKAAQVLRPGGRLAPFWNVFLPPPDVAKAFADVYRRVLPDFPINPWARAPLDAYDGVFARVADGIRAAGAFGETEQWRVDWERPYTREEWLDQVPSFGGHSRLAADQLAGLLEATGEAVDALGGTFTMGYAAVAFTAVRTQRTTRPATRPSSGG